MQLLKNPSSWQTVFHVLRRRLRWLLVVNCAYTLVILYYNYIPLIRSYRVFSRDKDNGLNPQLAVFTESIYNMCVCRNH